MPKSNRTPKKAQRIEDVRSQTPPADIPSSFESPESSSIACAIYHSDTQMLRVYLKRDPDENDCYEYAGFPANLWAEFVGAESKGRFFAHMIRPLFVGKKLDV